MSQVTRTEGKNDLKTFTVVVKKVDWMWKNFLFIFEFAIVGFVFDLFTDDDKEESSFSILMIFSSLLFAVWHFFTWWKLENILKGTPLWIVAHRGLQVSAASWLTFIIALAWANGAFWDTMSEYMRYKHYSLLFWVILAVSVLLQLFNLYQVYFFRGVLKDAVEELGYDWKQILNGGAQ